MESLVRPAAATKGQSEIVCRRLSGLGLHRGFPQKNFRTVARGELRAMDARLYPAAPSSLSQSPISGLRCKAAAIKLCRHTPKPATNALCRMGALARGHPL